MDTKIIEIRDSATFIPAMITRLNPANEADRYLLSSSGFGISRKEQGEYVILTKLNPIRSEYVHHNWGACRTMGVAHKYCIENFDKISSGQVIDVQYILGESLKPKESQSIDEYFQTVK